MTEKIPIFQSVFAGQWPLLPPVMRKHYANRPYSKDVVTVEGIMSVKMSRVLRIFSPLMRIIGMLPPYAGENIPVTVHFFSERDSIVFGFDRIFRFPGKPPYHFRSRMEPVGENRIIEWMRIGIGWRAGYHWDGNKVTMTHEGYVARLFNTRIHLPLEWLFGRGNAWEEPLSEDRFRMHMDLRHPLLGVLYAYSGEFSITEMRLER